MANSESVLEHYKIQESSGSWPPFFAPSLSCRYHWCFFKCRTGNIDWLVCQEQSNMTIGGGQSQSTRIQICFDATKSSPFQWVVPSRKMLVENRFSRSIASPRRRVPSEPGPFVRLPGRQSVPSTHLRSLLRSLRVLFPALNIHLLRHRLSSFAVIVLVIANSALNHNQNARKVAFQVILLLFFYEFQIANHFVD